MTTGAEQHVAAIYELPVPIWISSACLGKTYPSGYGALKFDVVMPQEHSVDGGRPDIQGVGSLKIPDENPESWSANYAAWIPHEYKPATAVLRIAIDSVDAPIVETRSWAGPVDQLAEKMELWFDRVRTWVEVLTGQDLDPNHRVYDAREVGQGLTFIEPQLDGPAGLQLSTPHVQPVTESQWSEILLAVLDLDDPPLEYVLHRDARAAYQRGFFRRSVIDAASAVEITLARVLDQRKATLPENQQNRLNGTASLGRYISIAEDSGMSFRTSFADLRQLSSTRNDAIHRSREPESMETAKLLQTAVAVIQEFNTLA